MTTTLDTRLKAKSVTPSLTVDDVQKSVAFFEGLGFGVEERWEENGVLQGVTLRAGDTAIHISQDDWKKGRDREKGQAIRLFVNTGQDIDQLAADAKKAGITLDKEPYEAPWGGSRIFDVTEPSGFKLTFSS